MPLVRTVNVHEAKTHLSTLLAAVEGGEEIVIARAGRPVALLSRFLIDKRPIGMDDGKITIPEDFDRSIPDEFEPYL
jgi:antitoxin (DNA-binding transcriptional repressor) of toxin-antitoxin stability system